MYTLCGFLSRLRNKKPYILSLYNWNRTKTEAHCTKEDFNIVFAGYNVIHDKETNKVFAPFHVGDKCILVIRDDGK